MNQYAPAWEQCRRKVFILLLILIWVLANSSAAFAGLGPNLISNPSLEAGTSTPAGWQQVKTGTSTASFTYPVAGFSDARAAEVNVTARQSGDVYWQPPVAQVTGGSQYQFTGYAKSNVPVSIIAAYGKNGKISQVVNLGRTAGTNTWEQFSATVTIPIGIREARIQHVLQSNGVLAIDNYALQLVTADSGAPTCSISASPASITAGASATLTFSSTNATGGTIDNNVGTVGTSGTRTVSPQATTTYTGTFTGSGGVTATCSTTVTVSAGTSLPVISSFTATPASITQGQQSTLSWAVSGATALSISNVGTVTGTSVTVSPAVTTNYVLTATNNAGSATANQTVTVGSAPTTPPPTCSLSASPTSIAAGSTAILSYSSTNATSGTINNNVGPVGTSGTKSVAPAVTTTYTATFTGGGGTAQCSATVSVTAAPGGSNMIQNGDFETASSSSASVPLNWFSSVWDATATFSYPVPGKDGSGKGARVTTSRVDTTRYGGATWAFNPVSVSSRTIYQYRNDYSSNVATSVSVEFRHTNGAYTYHWLNDLPATGSAWGNQVINISVPTDVTSFTVIHGLGRIGSLTLDNVSLVAMPATPFPSGMVTLTFDDGLISQFNNAVPMLRNAGLTATFAIITSMPSSGASAYMNWTQIRNLAGTGFEIASHTQTHASLTTIGSSQAQQEIEGAYRDLAAQGLSPTTFIYPYGDVNATVKQMVRNSGHIGARGSYFGMNAPFGDRYAVYDIRVDSNTQFSKITQAIDQAIADRRWLILEFHDVLASGGNEYSITPTMMQNIINYIKSSGITAVTLNQGMNLMQ